MPGAPPLSVFDAHVDSLQLALDCGRDLGRAGAGHLDLERGREGGLGTAVFVAWVDPEHLAVPGAARARAERLLDELDVLCARHPGSVRWVRDGRELEAAHAAGCIAAVAGIEGAHAFEGDPDALACFYERGVRVLTLCWNNHLPWIRSCQPGAGPGVPEGLSAEGRTVVRTLNELGVLVDVSHAGERSFYDVLEAADRPVIASHSGARALHDHPRNLSDDQLRALASHGGVVGIVFCTAFLDATARALESAERESPRYRAIAATNATLLNLRQGEHLQAVLPPLPLERVCDHVVHAAEVAGVEHVGLGSDFDGIQRRPEGLEHAGCYGALADALRGRGFDEQGVRAVLGGNMERVFARATGASGPAQRRGPGEGD